CLTPLPPSFFSMKSAMATLSLLSAQQIRPAVSFMPADPVAFGERDCRAGAPTPRGIGFYFGAFLRPDPADGVDPVPLRFHFVASDEQGRLTMDQVEQQPLIGNAPPYLGECLGERQVQRHFA